jgi:hypothetical protein
MSSLVDTAKTVYDLAKKGITVELQEKVMQLREEALELQEENLSLKKENLKLKEQIELQEIVKFKRRVYWRDGDEIPFCAYCFEKSHRLIHLSGPRKDGKTDIYKCEDCGIAYYTVGESDFAIWVSRMVR